MAIKLLDQATDPLKTASKMQFKKQWKQLVIWLVMKLMIKLQKSQKLCHKNFSKTVTNETEMP